LGEDEALQNSKGKVTCQVYIGVFNSGHGNFELRREVKEAGNWPEGQKCKEGDDREVRYTEDQEPKGGGFRGLFSSPAFLGSWCCRQNLSGT
jgi:hypothetical protein